MKKRFQILASLFLLNIVVFTSCKKDATSEKPNEELSQTEQVNVANSGGTPNVSVLNSRLKFNTLTDYKLLYDDANDAVNYTVLDQIVQNAKTNNNFINLDDIALDSLGNLSANCTNLTYTYSLIDSVRSGLILQIFNPDGIFQVGTKIIKLSLDNKEVYVLDEANEAAGIASLKSANPSHPTITKLIGEQALLTNLGETWKCDGDDAEESNNTLAYHYYNGDWRQKCEVFYRRWALHKILASYSTSYKKTRVFGWIKNRADHTVRTNLEKWQTRCGKQWTGPTPYETFTANRWYGDKLYFEKFTGAKLARYHIKSQFKLFNGAYSPELEIKYGY